MANDDRIPRVLLDTNVLVSAIISRGNARELVNKAIEERKFSIVISEPILKELMTVLRRPTFKTSDDEINKVVLSVIQTGEVVTVVSSFQVVKGDPEDNIILNTAHDGKVNMIVTGDRHLRLSKESKYLGYQKQCKNFEFASSFEVL